MQPDNMLKRQTKCVEIVLLPAFLTVLFPGTAYAYIGPGAGFAFLGSFFVFFLAFFFAFLALLSWPLRFLLRLRGNRAGHCGDAKVDKAIVIGFDGMEPSLVERFMDQGFLPNFARLRAEGTYRPLESTLPPLSPVAWSTFQTGVEPGKHSIFDFLHRNPKTYLGELSSARIQSSKKALRFGKFQLPLGKPTLRGLRRSQPFWRLLGDRGIYSMILRVPITFPPERFKGISLSAMCVPDLRGTQGTFSYYTTRPQGEGGKTGGQVILLEPQNGSIRTWITGPMHPFRNAETALKTPLHVKLSEGSLRLKVNGTSYRLQPGQYSPWVSVPFRAGPFKIRGIVRFYLRRIEPFLELYMTPVNIDPANPSLPISHPKTFSVYLAKRFGPYATLGLAEDTWALNEGILDDPSFLKQCYDIHLERTDMFWDAMDHLRKGLMVCVFDITDRTQHMFWRYEDNRHPGHDADTPEPLGDVFQKVYQEADKLVGQVLHRIDSDTLLVVMSDHGFRSFRRCFNVNTWLHRNGYLSFLPDQEPGEWFGGVDWSQTKAFAVGLAGVYINQKGRERDGIVAPGEETERLKAELIAKLKGLRDPDTGETAILDVTDTRVAYNGPYKENAQDLIIGYNEGFRTAWESATGRVGARVFYDNTKKWSGDHCLPPHRVPGVFFSNFRFAADHPGIVDLAPTILAAFGVDPPEYMDGKALPFDAGYDLRAEPPRDEAGTSKQEQNRS
jgi:predicted AlkP superfamily phosphohydrolase/phosphomutase